MDTNHANRKIYFDHEKLRVYQESLKFVSWTHDLMQKINKKYSVVGQLDRASTSIPLNIAEGNGKFGDLDRCRFFDIARGSALESASCLDVLEVKHLVASTEIEPGKEMLHAIVSMLVGLIKSNSDRVHEESGKYE